MKEEGDKLLKTISWLDEKRWKSETNYNIILNEIFDNLSNSEKILVHWISYITDRQMRFEKIWIDGGKVFSGVVSLYSKNGYNYFKEKPFIFLKIQKFEFRYECARFSSRFITTDIKSILLALRILEDYNRNIVSYVSTLFNKFKFLIPETKEGNPVNLIAFILHLLSYELVKKDINDVELKSVVEYFEEVESYYLSFKEILESEKRFKEEYQEFVKDRFKGKKRTWCCVRDYFKSYFKDFFIKSLKEEKANKVLLDIFNDKNQLFYLELPGDVWNLNPIFREKLLEPCLGKFEKKKFAEELRNKLKKPYYPELFDLSFDFVRRMCENSNNKINGTMCELCLFGSNGMTQYCHKDSTLYCPIVMICCGYEYKCSPEDCPVNTGDSKGLCLGITKKRL